ncbi:MAG: phasin family protein [Paraburkholderia sp.]|uniref:TIGR01841 family phasin n=1 Tax=Paraburkholderia sp. TaxID=1926495 RepID=UPI00122955DD|nr:TIGR01841 family phasin [Paraburkholderia sp.]TAM07008.1 MAG: phasin family protein [Paraburkholderia sp.]
MQVQELVFATQKSSVEMFIELSSAFAVSVDRLALLNIQATRSMLSATHDFSQQALSTTDPSEWITLQDRFVVPAAQQVQDYNRQLLDIAAVAQGTCVRCMQSYLGAFGERTRTLLNDFAKSAPQGSAPIVAALDSVIGAANELYGSLQQTGQQALEAARFNIDMAATAAAKRTAEPSSQAMKR